jgi:chromosome segregation ATPase
MKIEDEDQIPKKPEVILEKPNDKHYEKQLKELKDKITHHKNSITEYKEKIKLEKIGNNPEIKALRQEKDDLNAKIDVMKKELDELKKTCDGVSTTVKNLRDTRASLESELEVKNMDDYNDELRSIQKKLGYGNFNAVEEKKLIDKKAKLELQKPKIEKLNQATQKIKELNTKYGPQLKKIGELVKKNKVLYEEKRVISTKLKAAYETRQSNDPAIKNLQAQVESVKKNIDELKEQINIINAEWDEKWYKYEDQQALLDYIKRATDHVNQLKKKADKDRKRREKAEKKAAKNGETVDEDNDDAVVTKKKEFFSYEMGQIEWLLKYFRSLTNEEQKVSNNQTSSVLTQTKIDEDLKKGTLKVMNKDDQFPEVDSSKGFNKKKGKKDKKENKKASNILTLDIIMISRVKELGLNPPMNLENVKPFIGELEGKLKFFQEESRKKSEEESDKKVENVQEESRNVKEEVETVQENPEVNAEEQN